MKRLIIVALFCLFANFGSALSVTSGTVTVTQPNPAPAARDYLLVWTIDWLSDSSGNVVVSITEINGTIERIVYNPDDAATSPTDQYDMVLTDVDGFDCLNGTGSNLAQGTATSTVTTEGDGTTNLPFAVAGTLMLTITNAGNAKGGIVRIYIRR